ncbi:MAG: MFS transporter, partial [Cytophagaceae bacterium]
MGRPLLFHRKERCSAMTRNAAPLSVADPAPLYGLVVGLVPLFLIVFFGFLAIGVSLAPLSVQVQEVLRFNTITVGLVVGLQSLVTVACRHRSGTLSDQRGPKLAVLLGLPLTSLGGIAYLLSAGTASKPTYALAAILLGRVVLGLGESLFITGAMSWGISRVGQQNT